MDNPFRARLVSRRRAVLVMAIALALDGFQFALGPLGWTFADEVLDVLGLAAFSLLLGFHPLLLPTFVVELVPVMDMLPTWTACAGAVLMLRKRSGAGEPPVTVPAASAPVPPKPDKTTGPVVDV